MICTKSKLNEEIKHIKNILLDNGYPESIILNATFPRKLLCSLYPNDLTLKSPPCI